MGCCRPGRARRLAAEALDELVVLGEAAVEQLQRDAAAELQVLGAVDVGHPARADPVEHLVALVDDRVAGDAVDAHPPSASSTCLATGAATTPPVPPWTRSSTTATAKSFVKPMNQGSLILLLDVDLRGAGLAGQLDALERRRRAGALLDHVLHHRRQLRAPCSGFITRSASSALDLVLRAAVRVDDLLRDVGLHPHAAVGDRRGDGRHLQRRDQQLVLADRHAPDVDPRRARPQQLAVRAALARGQQLVGGQVDRRLLVEAVPRHVLGHGLLAQLLTDLRPTPC